MNIAITVGVLLLCFLAGALVILSDIARMRQEMIEQLSAEDRRLWRRIAELVAERNALQARLDALEAQHPGAYR